MNHSEHVVSYSSSSSSVLSTPFPWAQLSRAEDELSNVPEQPTEAEFLTKEKAFGILDKSLAKPT
jgi:hypothetical protein